MVTGAIYKGFVFDGIDSKQYGVYITGQGVFDAPVRDVEMIEIPGRNGSYALDKGRFKNIEVTYPAGMFGNTDAEFMQGISDLRNALASRKGYCRLTDEYNPNEYRMAVYKSGLEVSPAQLKAGQFDITFECKPQRFLASGETQQTVTSGATITNPTLFESHPLLLVDGYGDIDINGESISIQQGAVMGKTLATTTDTQSQTDNSDGIDYILNRTTNLTSVSVIGDTITVGKTNALVRFIPWAGYIIEDINNVVLTDGSIMELKDLNASRGFSYAAMGDIEIYCSIDGNTFTRGTSKTVTDTASVSFTSIVIQGYLANEVWNFDLTINYDGGDLFVYTLSIKRGAGTDPLLHPDYNNAYRWEGSNNEIYVQSTKSALGQLYIDLDIGECYRIENGQIISINTATILPADLPTFNPGANTITYDNTFTSFKVTPRWWKV